MTALMQAETKNTADESVFTDELGRPITTSIAIAERFGKTHKHVLRDIESLECSESFSESNFGLTSYKDKSNRNSKMYNVTRDGFMFLVMGYTGKDAALVKETYIKAFNELERLVTDPMALLDDPMRLRTMLLQASERFEKAKPAIAFYEDHKVTDEEVSVTVWAKSISNEVKLTREAIHGKYLYKHTNGRGEVSWVPRQQYVNQGLFKERFVPIQRSDGTKEEKVQALITSKGRRVLHKYISETSPELLKKDD